MELKISNLEPLEFSLQIKSIFSIQSILYNVFYWNEKWFSMANFNPNFIHVIIQLFRVQVGNMI